MKKVFSTLATILSYFFFALCIAGLVFVFSAKRNEDGGANIFGRQLRLVASNSMEACEKTDTSGYAIGEIPVKALVVIELVPTDKDKAKIWYDGLKVGDVLTFRYVYLKQETITHRIIEIVPKEGGYLFRLQGDNQAAEGGALVQELDSTQTNTPNYIIGRVTKVRPFVGRVLSILKEPEGLVCMIIIPCLALMFFEISRLKRVFYERERMQQRYGRYRRAHGGGFYRGKLCG